MPVHTHPQSQDAAYLFDLATHRLGVAAASRWMFSANVNLDGRSPVEAIKAGELALVHRIVMKLGGDS
jgi:hypothetical protein